uniref:RSVR protein n=1 Tax=Otus sunia TaxID=257818 RepID=A0A8C8ECR9_9STRI
APRAGAGAPSPPCPCPAAPRPGCPPGQFQCEPGTPCLPSEWRCDEHPDCDDEQDEWGCGTLNPPQPSPEGAWVTPPWSAAVRPTGSAEASATPVPGGSVPACSQGHVWILITAALLSILVAVGSLAVWGLSKAKTRSDIFSLEKASREQLMPDKSQIGSFPGRVSFLHPTHSVCMREKCFLALCFYPLELSPLCVAFPSCSCCWSATCLGFQCALKQRTLPLLPFLAVRHEGCRDSCTA